MDFGRDTIYHVLTSPVFIGLGIPTLMTVVVVVIRWIQHRGGPITRDDIVLGYELSLAALALSATKSFEALGSLGASKLGSMDLLWRFGAFGKDFDKLKAAGTAELIQKVSVSSEAAATMWVALMGFSGVVLLIVMGLMQSYIDQKPKMLVEHNVSISNRMLWGINGAGVVPLFISLFAIW